MNNNSNKKWDKQLFAEARKRGFLQLDHGQAGDEIAIRQAWRAWDAYCGERRVPRIVLDVPNHENCCLEFDANSAGNVWPLDKPLECSALDGEASGITVTALFSNVLHPIVKVEADTKQLEILLQVATAWAARFGTSGRD